MSYYYESQHNTYESQPFYMRVALYILVNKKMAYKIVGNYKNESLWEIAVFKYNMNHQEFIRYVKEGSEAVQKKVFRTELI